MPIGSESRIAKSLRGYPFVTKADLPIGMYGGAQREALLLKRDKFKTRKKFDKNKTRNLLRLALNQYFDSARPINCNVVTSTQKAPYKIENEKITPNGFFNTFSFDVYVDPQYTRCLAAHWDTFKLYIDIFDSVMNKKGEISASVFVEELRTVTKGGGGVPPSTLTWYKKPDGDQNEIESDAVFHLVVGMSRYLDGSCYFEAGEDYEVPEGVEQCKENAFPG